MRLSISFSSASIIAALGIAACGGNHASTTSTMSSSGSGASTSSSGHGGGSTTSSASGGATNSSASAGGASSASTTSTASTGTGGVPALGTGKTYYVDPKGDDANDGSATSPWATIQHAGGIVQTGDTVIVRAGTYAGAVFCWDGPNQGDYGTIAGKANDPITFEADPAAPAGSVVIDTRNAKTPSGFDLEPGCDYVNVIGFTIDNSHDFSMKDAGLRLNGNADVAANNVVRYVNCTSVPADHAAAAGQSAGGKGFGVIADAFDGLLLEGNDVAFTCGTGGSGHGFYLSGSSTGGVVRMNRFHDNGSLGIHINGDASQGAPGIVTQTLIDANVVADNGDNGINADGLQTSTIQNNVVYGNDRNGITLYQIDAGGPSKDVLIVDNTIVEPSSTGAAVRLANDNGPTTNITVFDNILIGGSAHGAFDDDTGCTCASDYNISASALNSGTAGNDAHSTVHTAMALLFANLAGNDYHLGAGSPAIGAGAASFSAQSAPAKDAAGMPRPNGGSWDVGAYEH